MEIEFSGAQDGSPWHVLANILSRVCRPPVPTLSSYNAFYRIRPRTFMASFFWRGRVCFYVAGSKCGSVWAETGGSEVRARPPGIGFQRPNGFPMARSNRGPMGPLGTLGPICTPIGLPWALFVGPLGRKKGVVRGAGIPAFPELHESSALPAEPLG